MSGDLLTLRMMLVTASDAAYELWRQGTALASLPIELSRIDLNTLESDRAVFDVIVFGPEIPPALRDSIIKANVSRPAPLIAALAPAGADALEGVAVIFPIPENPALVRAICERCIRMRLPKRVLVVDDS